MRKYIAIILLVATSLIAGCSSVPSNYITPQKTLSLNDVAVFEKDGVSFTARVESVEISPLASGAREVTVRIAVTNPGTKGVSLIAYPRITDAIGREYAGRNIFFGQIGRGGVASEKSTITVPTADQYEALQKEAYLRVRFQDMTPVPSEGIWALDLKSLE